MIPKGTRGQGFKDSSEMLINYKELKVWQKAYELCLDVYNVTKYFPSGERFGLNSQLRRASVSIPSNIAEGYGKRTTPDYIRSLYIAYGSNCELETQTLISGDLAYIEKVKQKKLLKKISEVERMLKALIKSLECKN